MPVNKELNKNLLPGEYWKDTSPQFHCNSIYNSQVMKVA